MKNAFMKDKELNVKAGDKVSVLGNIGIVTEVIKKEDWTGVRVHFGGDLANYGQYQDQVYGGYVVID